MGQPITTVISATGAFTYTPEKDFFGSDSFAITVSDGHGGTDTATINVTVTNVNDAPVINEGSSDTTLTVANTETGGGTIVASDVDSSFTFSISVAAGHGSVEIGSSSGVYTYTPDANYNGPDNFTYKASDGTLLSNTAIVALTVQSVADAPVAVGDSFDSPEDTTLTINAPGLLANDSDADGGLLTPEIVAQPKNGSVVSTGNGGFTYTPNQNFSGQDSFTYRISDGGLFSNVATVLLNITPLLGAWLYGGSYDIGAYELECTGVFTNTTPTDAYRGAGRPEATYAIERVIDLAAAELGLDRIELRRRNLIPASAMPFKTGLVFTYDCGDFARGLEMALALAEAKTFPDRREQSRRRGRLRGLGLANPIEVAGGPYTAVNPDTAELCVNADGSVSVFAGSTSMGQGNETAFAQIVDDVGRPHQRDAGRPRLVPRPCRHRPAGSVRSRDAALGTRWRCVDARSAFAERGSNAHPQPPHLRDAGRPRGRRFAQPATCHGMGNPGGGQHGLGVQDPRGRQVPRRPGTDRRGRGVLP